MKNTAYVNMLTARHYEHENVHRTKTTENRKRYVKARLLRIDSSGKTNFNIEFKLAKKAGFANATAIADLVLKTAKETFGGEIELVKTTGFEEYYYFKPT